MLECPGEEQLAAFAADSPDAANLSEHVRECAKCRSWLERDRKARAWLDDLRECVHARGSQSRDVGDWTSPAWAPAPSARPDIPDLEILRPLSEGGQGVVYEAVQRATKRTVAVKLLLPGVHQSPAARRRFEREIELVAQLRHPHIVSVYHSGYLSDGTQYYAMEYVAGASLREHVRRERLGTAAILELVATIAEALQHAHQHGVIHRDLKPSNILIDALGQPRIVDFGLAKRCDDASGTLISATHEIMGTLPYMAPEQAGGATERIDTRTDVYALGVILYELLTGRYPYPVEGPLPEVCRHIVETPPLPPRRASGNTRSPALRESLPSTIDADLETIVLKALSKEPERRYQSAADLARDIRHSLRHEPIEARRDNSWYVLRKSLRRYRAATASMAVLLLVISVALLAVVGFWREAVHQTRLARAAQLATEVAHDLTPVSDADVSAHWRNLQRIHGCLREHDSKEVRDALATRLAEEEQGLIEDAETSLATNRLLPLAELLVRDAGTPDLRSTLRRLGLVNRLCERLALWIRVPPPVGRGYEMETCLQALRRLDPTNARAQQLSEAWGRISHALPAHYEEEFDFGMAGVRPNGWQPKHGVEECVFEAGGGMLVASTAASSGVVEKKVGPIDANVVVLTWTFEIIADDATQLMGDARAQLIGPEGMTICSGGVHAGRFEYTRRTQPGGEIEILRSEPVVPGRRYRCEIRYSRTRRTYDVLINGEYLVEEAQQDSEGPITKIGIGPNGGVRMLVHEVRLRKGDQALKKDLGKYVPLIAQADLPLDCAAWVDWKCGPMVARDFDGDGRNELVSGDTEAKGTLSFVHLTGTSFAFEKLASSPLTSVAHVEVLGWIDRWLAVWGIGERSANGDGEARGFALLDIGRDYSAAKVFGKSHNPPGHGRVERVRLPDRTLGLAVALGENEPTIELYRQSGSSTAPTFELLRRLRPYNNDRRQSPTIYSIRPFDRDDDGVDELAVGWWHRDGYRAGIVDLADAPWDEPDGQAAAGRDPFEIPAKPLMRTSGLTRLAIAQSNSEKRYLIAATEKVDGTEAATGTWVWEITPQLGRHEIEPSLFVPSNVIAVATGRLNGVSLFLTASLDVSPVAGTTDLVLRGYGTDVEPIRQVWEARIYDFPGKTADLCMADANSDGQDELLVALGRDGLFIFSASNRHGCQAADAARLDADTCRLPEPP